VPDSGAAMLAVVPVRDGLLPAGGAETVAECDGIALLVGTRPGGASLEGVATSVQTLELGPFQVGRWVAALAPLVQAAPVVVLPASPDGRDLAPRLAHALDRPLLAGATEVRAERATLVRDGGRRLLDVTIDRPVVATLQPGVRGVVATTTVPPVVAPAGPPANLDVATADPVFVAELAPDSATVDLADASRIVAAGAGLDGPARIRQLAAIAAALDATVGATRVVTDRGWLGHERQIGTTGVTVDPALYVAFGISGAVQHTAGLGTPGHVVSVNTDAHCPMMGMADLAVVADANAVLDAMERLLDEAGADA
jgi:electron transfer flavoprotein alpha subunit